MKARAVHILVVRSIPRIFRSAKFESCRLMIIKRSSCSSDNLPRTRGLGLAALKGAKISFAATFDDIGNSVMRDRLIRTILLIIYSLGHNPKVFLSTWLQQFH